MEPRVVGSEGATCWDIGTNPPDTLFEVKLNPTRGDFIEWLTRVAAEAPLSPDRAFILVYSKCGGTLLTAFELGLGCGGGSRRGRWHIPTAAGLGAGSRRPRDPNASRNACLRCLAAHEA